MPKPPRPPGKLLRPLASLTLRTPDYVPSEAPMSFYDYVKQLIALNKKEPHLLSVANVEQAWRDRALNYYRKRPNRFAIVTRPASMESGWDVLARFRAERQHSTIAFSTIAGAAAAPISGSRASANAHDKPLNLPYLDSDPSTDFTYERFLSRLRRCNSGVDIGRAEAWHCADVFVERLRARFSGGKSSAKLQGNIEQLAKSWEVQEKEYWRRGQEQEGKEGSKGL